MTLERKKRQFSEWCPGWWKQSLPWFRPAFTDSAEGLFTAESYLSFSWVDELLAINLVMLDMALEKLFDMLEYSEYLVTFCRR